MPKVAAKKVAAKKKSPSKKKPAPKKKIAAKKKGKKHELEVVNGKTGKRSKTGKKIIVIDRTPGSKLYEEMRSELDGVKEQIKTGAREIGTRFYELGCALRLVRDKKLFTVDKCRSFTEWIEQEFEKKRILTRATGYNMIAVAESVTREEAARYGPTICYVIARATDAEARRELVNLASNGASTVEIKHAAKKQRKEAGVVPRSTGRPKTVTRAVKISEGDSGVVETKVDERDVKASRRARAREGSNVDAGMKGTHGLKKTKKSKTTEKKIGDGWTHRARFQIGSDGPELLVEVNMKKKLIKYRVM